MSVFEAWLLCEIELFSLSLSSKPLSAVGGSCVTLLSSRTLHRSVAVGVKTSRDDVQVH